MCRHCSTRIFYEEYQSQLTSMLLRIPHSPNLSPWKLNTSQDWAGKTPELCTVRWGGEGGEKGQWRWGGGGGGCGLAENWITWEYILFQFKEVLFSSGKPRAGNCCHCYSFRPTPTGLALKSAGPRPLLSSVGLSEQEGEKPHQLIDWIGLGSDSVKIVNLGCKRASAKDRSSPQELDEGMRRGLTI